MEKIMPKPGNLVVNKMMGNVLARAYARGMPKAASNNMFKKLANQYANFGVHYADFRDGNVADIARYSGNAAVYLSNYLSGGPIFRSLARTQALEALMETSAAPDVLHPPQGEALTEELIALQDVFRNLESIIKSINHSTLRITPMVSIERELLRSPRDLTEVAIDLANLSSRGLLDSRSFPLVVRHDGMWARISALDAKECLTVEVEKALLNSPNCHELADVILELQEKNFFYDVILEDIAKVNNPREVAEALSGLTLKPKVHVEPAAKETPPNPVDVRALVDENVDETSKYNIKPTSKENNSAFFKKDDTSSPSAPTADGAKWRAR